MAITGFLNRLGLHRPELRAWAMYDWANSAFMTTIVAAVFPIFFLSEAAATLEPATAQSRFSWASTIAVAIVAVLSPVLGALADYKAAKKKFLALFLGLGAGSTALMVLIHRGDWLLAAVLFVFGNIGVIGSLVFYDSLLPHIASADEADRVSTAGYAIGYLGGGLLLALNLAWIADPEAWGIPDAATAARLSFASVALWWLLFAIPLFVKVAEPTRRLEADEQPRGNAVAIAFTRVRETLRELRLFKQAFLLLVAFAIYNDGINTIIRMATSYGTLIGLQPTDLIPAILLVQFAGVPFAFLFGMLAGRIGAKQSIFLALAVYTGISVLAYFMTTAAHFYLLAFLVATVQGGSQALSRSMFATMIPRHKSSEFFAFFGIFEKFTGVLGPAIFAFTVGSTGSGRIAILSIIGFFIVGGLVLSRVDVAAGQRAAREAERSLRPVT
jgi:UMF1 family MFS transporter